ncbi:MAG: hypothetical protein K6F86_06545 [Lachnospiraceae bacterium]|nr:hypothetical protein [Lachnospiraceae bacterium]
MDNFMDRLVEKINMQNSRTRRDRSEDEIYKNTGIRIEEFRNSTHEDIENLRKEAASHKDIEETKTLLNEGFEKIITRIDETGGDDKEDIKTLVSDVIHKEDVKLYRNVQAVIQDENGKTLAGIEELKELLDSDETEKIKSRLDDIESVEGVVAGRTSGLKGLLTGVLILLILNLLGVGFIIAHFFGLI